MSKHTSGPWEKTIGPHNGLNGFAIHNKSPVYIGYVGTSEDADETIVANANLVAAAPDLLDAALSAKVFIKNLPHDHQNQMMIDFLEKAIAKATGEK